VASLRVNGVTKEFGAAAAVRDVSFVADEGEFVSLLGPSGCGKTTTLRMIAGLLFPDAGTIQIAGTDVTALPPYRRSASLVFQNYALFPHMTVRENVAFGLRMRGFAGDHAAPRIRDMLDLVGMRELEGRYPRQLSGGQQQRVALARSLVVQPSVLLLDEPLSNLDAKLREEMRVELRLLQQRLNITTVFVTHDQEEALAMSDRVIVMRAGSVQQDATPTELFNRPRTDFVARFIGSANVLEGTWRDGALVSPGGLRIRTDAAPPGSDGARGVVAVRPQNVKVATQAPLSRQDADRLNVASATITLASYRGSYWLCGMRLHSGEEIQANVTSDESEPNLAPGSDVTVYWEPRHTIPVIPDS